MNTGGSSSATTGRADSLMMATLLLGITVATIVVVAVMISPSTVQASTNKQDPKAPPGYDPNSPKSKVVPLELETVTEGEIGTLALANTNCTARLDLPHASRHSNYTRVGGWAGVQGCTYKKKRIWVKVALQKWVPHRATFVNVKIRKGHSYGTRRNVRAVYRDCAYRPTYYRLALLRATIVDYDGDVHRPIFRRYGDWNKACKSYY